MKRFALVVTTLLACSSSGSNPPPADAGPDVDLAAYEAAVKSAKWSLLPNGPQVSGGAKMDDVYFVNASLGFAASGPDSALFRTKDGGASWQQVFTHKGTYFRAVLFLDEKHGFAGNLGAGLTPSIDDTTVLYETKDGGDAWAPVTGIQGPAPAGICNLTAASSTAIFAVGRANGPAHLIASSDAGATWTSTDLAAQMSMLIDARFTSATEGLIVGQNKGSPSVCTILKTTDGGQSWNKVFSSTTKNSLCWKVQFPSAKVGYVSVEDGAGGPPTFVKTTDGGDSWTELPLPTNASPKGGYPALGIGFATDNVGWVSSEDDTLPTYYTTDGGQSWTEDATLKAPINRFRFVDRRTAYAIGGAVWKLSIPWTGN